MSRSKRGQQYLSQNRVVHLLPKLNKYSFIKQIYLVTVFVHSYLDGREKGLPTYLPTLGRSNQSDVSIRAQCDHHFAKILKDW